MVDGDVIEVHGLEGGGRVELGLIVRIYGKLLV